jgi:chromosome condensin MukBEF ATPase and DNA-binding subunit MukB
MLRSWPRRHEARTAPARAAEREVQRLRGELAQRETALAAQQATQAGVAQRLAEVERKAAWDRQELAGLVTAAERKAARLQAKSEAEARTNQRSRRNLRLWQACGHRRHRQYGRAVVAAAGPLDGCLLANFP